MVQQEKPGERQGEQHKQPTDPSANQQVGQNQAAQRPPAEGEKEAVTRDADAATWGTLPDYMGAIKQRGGVPEVSEKYRKLYDAYLKAQAKKPSSAPTSGR